jgi:hypothetical protein
LHQHDQHAKPIAVIIVAGRVCNAASARASGVGPAWRTSPPDFLKGLPKPKCEWVGLIQSWPGMSKKEKYSKDNGYDVL